MPRSTDAPLVKYLVRYAGLVADEHNSTLMCAACRAVRYGENGTTIPLLMTRPSYSRHRQANRKRQPSISRQQQAQRRQRHKRTTKNDSARAHRQHCASGVEVAQVLHKVAWLLWALDLGLCRRRLRVALSATAVDRTALATLVHLSLQHLPPHGRVGRQLRRDH